MIASSSTGIMSPTSYPVSSDPALHDSDQLAALEDHYAKLRANQGPTPIKHASPLQTTAKVPPITFMEALRARGPPLPPNIGYTENGGFTHIETLDPLLDLFHELVTPLPPSGHLATMIDKAWTIDPTACLRIIFHVRSIPNGKGERIGFYCALGSVWEKSPRSVLSCLEEIVEPRSAKVNKKKADKDKSKTEGEGGEGNDQMDGLIPTEPAKGIAIAADGDADMVGEMVEEMMNEIKKDKVQDDESLTPRNARSHGFFNDLNVILLLASKGLLASSPDSTQIASLLCITDHNQSRTKHEKKAKGAELKSRWRKDRKLKVENNESFVALKEKRVREGAERQKEESRIASEGRWEKAREARKKVEDLYASDLGYRLLHIRIANIFASHLEADLQAISSSTSITSLAAKWLPTASSSLNRDTLITESVACILFPDEPLKYALRKLQHKYLTPLRDHTRIPERSLSEKKCSEVHYSRVPSKAMQRYKKTFMDKDGVRFKKYLEDVQTGKKIISGATLTPAEFVKQVTPRFGLGYHDFGTVEHQQLVNLSWNTLVKSVRDAGGAVGEALAVADVSGSMLSPKFKDGTSPIDSSIGLSMLLAELAPAPFAGTFLTFSTVPEMIELDLAQGFCENVLRMVGVSWGMSTDIIALFRLILHKAVQAKLEPAGMIKRLFIFSDMEFDACGGNTYGETHVEMVEREFKEQGYELPELVFWNLGSTASKPVTADRPGVALVSGYSAALLKVFLEGSDYEEPVNEDEELVMIAEDGTEIAKPRKIKMDSISIMKKAIGHPSFAGINAVAD